MIEKDSMSESTISIDKTQFISENKSLLNSSKIQADNKENVGAAVENNPAFRLQVRSNILALSGRITEMPSEGRSESFKALREALEKKDQTLRDIAGGDNDLGDVSYADFMELYQAVSAYMTSHATSTSAKSVEVYQAALAIRSILDEAARNSLSDAGPVNFNNIFYSDRETKHARDNVGGLMKYYVRYSMRVDADLLDSDENKAFRKWDALRSCERDIQVYLSDKLSGCNGQVSRLKGMDAFLYHEYNSLKTQMLLQNSLSGKKEKAKAGDDEGLSAQQIAAVSRTEWLQAGLSSTSAFPGDISTGTS